MSYQTFRHKIRDWRKKKWADEKTLEAANLDWHFSPYAATVQVNGNGSITQAWVKQSADSEKAYAALIDEIRRSTEPIYIQHEKQQESGHMLELSHYDMHFGIADFEWYRKTLEETLDLIHSRKWEKIIVVVGQDLFHNDDFRGRTSSGRAIEKVDMAKAWRDARSFYLPMIDAATAEADEMEIIYVRGNHDESMSWAFTQMLKERYGAEHVDDSLAYKKVRTFGKCFVGLAHGDAKKSSPRDLRGQFTVKFPVEFAGADVREIHTGHLHTEQEADEYGVMCRRLCSGNKQDDWSDSEGYEGAHKRFMLFDWSREKLSAIHYV